MASGFKMGGLAAGALAAGGTKVSYTGPESVTNYGNNPQNLADTIRVLTDARDTGGITAELHREAVERVVNEYTYVRPRDFYQPYTPPPATGGATTPPPPPATSGGTATGPIRLQLDFNIPAFPPIATRDVAPGDLITAGFMNQVTDLIIELDNRIQVIAAALRAASAGTPATPTDDDDVVPTKTPPTIKSAIWAVDAKRKTGTVRVTGTNLRAIDEMSVAGVEIDTRLLSRNDIFTWVPDIENKKHKTAVERLIAGEAKVEWTFDGKDNSTEIKTANDKEIVDLRNLIISGRGGVIR